VSKLCNITLDKFLLNSNVYPQIA